MKNAMVYGKNMKSSLVSYIMSNDKQNTKNFSKNYWKKRAGSSVLFATQLLRRQKAVIIFFASRYIAKKKLLFAIYVENK